jgi:hypothetical protein
MNNVTPERKERVMKSLAVFGLFGIIIFIAWVSVQIVSIFPTAIQSLASLADSVYTYNPKAPKDIVITPTTEPVTSGTKTTLHWEQPYKNGMYTFTYKCLEGVAVEIATSDSAFSQAECDKKYNLGSVNHADIVVHSEKQAEINFDYTLSYFKTNATKESVSTDNSFIVWNSRFTEGATPTTPEVTVNDEVITPALPTPTVTTPKPAHPIVTAPTYTFTYLPVSDSKGFTDLVVTYLGIGQKNSAGQFVNNGLLYKDVAGAIQFSVQNIGTKTSADWTFATKLPGDVAYTSTNQAPLKPNEKATLLIAFPAVTDTDLQKFSIEVKVSDDKNLKNNSIAWSTVVLK